MGAYTLLWRDEMSDKLLWYEGAFLRGEDDGKVKIATLIGVVVLAAVIPLVARVDRRRPVQDCPPLFV